jgi:formate dehydrogenase subunit gamma
MTFHPAWDDNLALKLINQYSNLEGAMLPILHALQHNFGYIDKRAIAPIANTLCVSQAEVFGVISFYSDFRTKPPIGATVKLCRAEGCQARGVENLVDHIQTHHGVTVDGDAHDGLQVQTVYCLGNCALGPNALYKDQVIGRLNAQSIDALCQTARLTGSAS